MSLQLIFKQSIYDFTRKILLYLNFTIFLILAMSLSVGLISFSTLITTSFNASLPPAPNSYVSLNEGIMPSWINIDKVDPSLEIKKHFDYQEKDESLTRFMFKVLNIPYEKATPSQKKDVNNLMLIIGIREFNTTELLTEAESKIKLLQSLIEIPPTGDEIVQKSTPEEIFKTYNNPDPNAKHITLPRVSHALVNKYQTYSLAGAFLGELFRKNDNMVLNWPARDWKWTGWDSNSNRSGWAYLPFNAKLYDNQHEDVWKTTPWSLKTKDVSKMKVYTHVNWESAKYKDYLPQEGMSTEVEKSKLYQYLFIDPWWLHQIGKNVGDTINLSPVGDYNSYNFLIAGTLVNQRNFYHGNNPFFQIPYQWNVLHNGDGSGYESNVPLSLGTFQIWRNTLFGNDQKRAQKFISDTLKPLFSSINSPNQPVNSSYDGLIDSLPQNAFALSLVIFNILGLLVGILILGLLFLVFFFITKEIIALQKNTLTFLKDLGASPFALSSLTTAALAIPILIGFCFSFFGSLLIQKMMLNISLQDTSFYYSFFAFSSYFFIYIFGLMLLSIIGFYLINTLSIHKLISTNTSEGKKISHALARLANRRHILFSHLSSKKQIGLSFVRKNIGQNLVTYFLLALTFSVILYSIQFKASFNNLVDSYERWNKPFKTVVSTESNPYYLANIVDENGDDVFIPTYKTIGENEKTNLIPIRDITDLKKALDAYQTKINNPSTIKNFSWTNYYLTKNFTKYLNSRIEDNPDWRDETLSFLNSYLPKDTTEQQKQDILDLLENATNKYQNIRDRFHDDSGINIFFGKTLLNESIEENTTAKSKNIRNVFSASTSSTEWGEGAVDLKAYEKNDNQAAQHFNFSADWDDGDFIADLDTTDSSFSKALKVNITSYAQTKFDLKKNQVIGASIPGLNHNGMKMYFMVNDIIDEDNVSSTIYSSQGGLEEYLVEMATFYANQSKEDQILKDINFNRALEAYKSLQKLPSISNTVYDARPTGIPWGFENLMIPLSSYSFNYISHPAPQSSDDIFGDWPPGSRLNDLYGPNLMAYLQRLPSHVMIFAEVTRITNEKAEPFVAILTRLLIILACLAFVISSILIMLVLLENRRIILLFKAMGYKQSEINWYLINGYFIAAFLAVITAVGVSVGMLNGTKKPIADFIGTVIYFTWNWQLFFWSAFMVGAFCIAMSVSIVIYTNRQKPREAFANL